jgi:hypothetical protein
LELGVSLGLSGWEFPRSVEHAGSLPLGRRDSHGFSTSY